MSSGSFENGGERYAVGAPSAQAVLDLFDGEWSSAMPPDSSLVTRPGHAALFDDARIHWAADRLGGFQGRTVLELGPLEGAHSYMLQRLGASSIASIEANTRAFLRCLCVKEIFGLDRVCFELGDFVSYMEEDKHSFDIVIACGVLYHMPDPIRVLELVAQRTDRLFLWTHYYDPDLIAARSDIRSKFGPMESFQRGGEHCQGAAYAYQEALDWNGFSGGTAEGSFWLTRGGIENSLRRLGFVHQEVSFDHPDHPNGPAYAICAWR